MQGVEPRARRPHLIERSARIAEQGQVDGPGAAQSLDHALRGVRGCGNIELAQRGAPGQELRVGARAEDRGRAGRRELRRVEPPHADRAVGELQRGDPELGPPVLHLVHQAAGLPARPPVGRPRGGELEPLCRQAIDHDLLLEEWEQVEIRHELVSLEQVLERPERARDGEPPHRDAAVPETQGEGADLHLGADHGGADRLNRPPGDPLREQQPGRGAERPEREQRSHCLPAKYRDVHLSARGGTDDRRRTASRR